MFDIDAALRTLVESEGSDLHLKVASPPITRVHGDLKPIPGTEPLTAEDTERALASILSDPEHMQDFDDCGEVDFAYSIAGVSRFRVNAFRQRGTISIVCRAIPYPVRSIDDLQLPPVIRQLADEQRGIMISRSAPCVRPRRCGALWRKSAPSWNCALYSRAS